MDPIRLAETLEARYLKYLATTFYFRDPELRASFEAALKAGKLCRGPYLEATPVFKRTRSAGEVFSELMESVPDESFVSALGGNRLLYKHQDDALRTASGGRNAIIATGTGSGKTEAFLYPILLHLYSEYRAGTLGAGVRALILYPMNALASDQRDRLGDICRRLEEGRSPFRFSFGQYTGETPENERDAARHAGEQSRNRRPGELVFRSEMRSSPPHILLTNYSMLEYLLVRPDDSLLFDEGRGTKWSFIVLDEAHQYRGARGMEMAMLLRRLKHRIIEGGRSGPFRCIATSATLMGGESDRAAVARFASSLFGEPFSAEDVILGETERISLQASMKLEPGEYESLARILREDESNSRAFIAEVAKNHGLNFSNAGQIQHAAASLLMQDERVVELLSGISGIPREAKQIADDVFSDCAPQKRIDALAALVNLTVFAQDPISDAPLLNARYHFLLRGLEGAFVSFRPRKAIQLERARADPETASFEVALCRECGQHYLVGSRGASRGHIGEAVRDPGQEDFGATFFRPLEDNDGEGNLEAQAGEGGRQIFQLCVRCGEVGRNQLPCGHTDGMRVSREPAPRDEDRADQVARCGFCGYSGAGRDPVREIVHGTDGPHAVIATTLFQQLPEDRRKILAFADGRQEAAFFAWYLESSYRDILDRNLVHQALKQVGTQAPDGLSLRELSNELARLYRERDVTPPAAGVLDVRREAWRSVYREFLTDEPRLSLEGVGLARWIIKWPDWFRIPSVLQQSPLSLTERESIDLIFLLLDTMRSDRAVEINTAAGVSMSWPDLQIQASQARYAIGAPGGDIRKRSWDGARTRRARLLAKLMHGVQNESESNLDVSHILRAVWETIVRCEEAAPHTEARLLLPALDARRLNPDWWRLQSVRPDEDIFQCDTCGRLHSVSVREICPRYTCSGKLKKLKAGQVDNHYRLLYEENLPGRMSVEEHTAQLEYEKAREFQRLFKEGRINVLSCSTTFELGVDLGDLDVAFLRNVPPEAFNYAQRVGRVGRRSGHPGFAVTYARRSPHDLYHFEEPLRLLTGKVQPPGFRLSNERIIIRHVTASALSLFFRKNPERFQTVESLCRALDTPEAVSDFRRFLIQHRESLEQSLAAIIPMDVHSSIGLAGGGWIDMIAGKDSRLALAEEEAASDFRMLKKLRLEAFEREDDRSVTWAGARMKTIARENVLSFLSRRAVIPKYGFPVDVVELDTQRTAATMMAAEVALQRDLSMAVAEFAPTSKLIANKRIWTSYALKRVAEREWERWWYARCPVHGRFERRLTEAEIRNVDRCCDRMKTYRYIEPRFGFVTTRDKPETPSGRPPRIFTTRPYFAGFKDGEGEALDFGPLRITRASPGYMVVLCEGRGGSGFYVCGQCGAGFRNRRDSQRGHKTPYGVPCPGQPECPAVSLGHEIITDVVKLQFVAPREPSMEPTWFAFSLAYALVEGTSEILEVPSTDLNATVAYSGSAGIIPPIVMYDTVPGGAGLVARLEDKDTLGGCLEAALKRVANCPACGEESSCYSCLRNYRNQFAHLFLRRGPVAGYLRSALLLMG